MPVSPVPMVDLAARHRRLAAPTEAAVLEVLRSGQWIGGPRLARFEERAAARFGRSQAVGVGNGTDAIVLALLALGIQPGDEVIVPALSFFATAGAVARVGARPVVVDVSDELPLMDPAAAQAAVGPRTRAAVPVHLFGMSCPDPGLPVPLVEDAAQAVGQDPPARLGVLSAVSFYPTKTLGGAGDGGLVATDDPELAAKVRALGNHGGVPGQAHLHERIAGHAGINSRLDPIQAAILEAHLDDLPRRVARRRAVAAAYDAALPSWIPPLPRAAGDPIHHYLLRSPQRDRVAALMSSRSIHSAVYYPRPLSAQPALQPQAACPAAERWCAECLSLPCHAELSDEQVERVCSALQELLP